MTAAEHDQPIIKQLYHFERGFTLVCYGAIAVLLLMTGVLRVDVLAAQRWPVFIVGFFMIACGMLQIYSGAKESACRAVAKRCLILAGLLCYFCPFYSWWRQSPYNLFLLTNLLLGLGCLIVWQATLNRLIYRLAGQLSEKYLRIQTQIGFAAVIVFELVPFIALIVGALAGVIRFHSHLYYELRHQLYAFPWWFMALSVFPITMTVANCWYIRSLCKEKVETKLAIQH